MVVLLEDRTSGLVVEYSHYTNSVKLSRSSFPTPQGYEARYIVIKDDVT
jgi:hypothetical protein